MISEEELKLNRKALKRNCAIDGQFCYEYCCDTNDVAPWKELAALGEMERWICPKIRGLSTKARNENEV